MAARRKKTPKKTSRVRSALSSIYKRMASVGQAGMARVRKLRNRTGPDHLAADEEDFAYIEKEAHDILGAIARLRSRDMGEYPLPEHFGMDEGPREANVEEVMELGDQPNPALDRWHPDHDATVEEVMDLLSAPSGRGDTNMTRGRRRNRAGSTLPRRMKALGSAMAASDSRDRRERKSIVDAMARALFVDAWASRQEEAGKRFRSGVDLMDQAPRTNKAAKVAAEDLANTIETRNNKRLTDLLRTAVSVGGEDNSDKFGHYLAMQSLGHGVSWFDDNPEFPLDLPYIEFYY